MRSILLLLLIITGYEQAAWSQPFPSKGTYHIFIWGQYAGTNNFEAQEEKNFLILHSVTEVNFEDQTWNVEAHTKLNKKTYMPISFKYSGTKPGPTTFSGTVHVKRDTIFGDIEVSGNTFPSKKALGSRYTLFFENYVVEHEIALARAFLACNQDFKRLNLFYPSDFLLAEALVSLESEVELQTKNGPMVCTKLAISQQGSIPFYSYLDMAEKLPIYIDFPGSSTELFLDGYFDKNPRTKYYKLEE